MAIRAFTETNMKLNELHIAVIALGAIFGLSALALFKGLDGVMFGSAIAGFGAVVGWVFKHYSRKK